MPETNETEQSDQQAELRQTILGYLSNQAPARAVHPSAIARAVAGNNEKEWRLLMHPLRSAIISMALDGEIEILRKGKVADPRNFKGVYQIRQCK